MTKPIIEIKNLSAGYDGRNVLHDINLAVYERDFLGIIGPNGGGKTTLIKCILGLLKPTGGEISFNCKPSLGYLPQYSTIDRKFPISVEEVILSGLSIQKSLTSRFTPEQKEKGKQIIARMGLEGLEHRAIGQLSGGQLQRALLGRAIISDPSVLILDEPSTYIDKRFEARLYELLAEINIIPIRGSPPNGWKRTLTVLSNCSDTGRFRTAFWVNIIITTSRSLWRGGQVDT